MKRMAKAMVALKATVWACVGIAVVGGMGRGEGGMAEGAGGAVPEVVVPTREWVGEGVGDYVMGPEYGEAGEFQEREGVPRGVVKTFVMESKESARYPGVSKERPGEVVPYVRKVGVYVPRQYVAGMAAPFIVCQDANHQNTLPTILDNMIAEGRVPAMVAVFVGNGGGDGKGSQRGLEYDTLSGKYAEFVQEEVLPRVEREAGVKLTDDPDGRATLGCSSGAAAAFTMAWYHPEWYRRVLSYSGTYVDQQWPTNPETPRGAWGYHSTIIPNSARKPIRVWMQVSENDLRAGDPESTLHNWVLANVRMAGVLKEKGYEYQFVFTKGTKHCDRRVVRATLPRALEWLWEGYRGM